jgi:hypothetical protein
MFPVCCYLGSKILRTNSLRNTFQSTTETGIASGGSCTLKSLPFDLLKGVHNLQSKVAFDGDEDVPHMKWNGISHFRSCCAEKDYQPLAVANVLTFQ